MNQYIIDQCKKEYSKCDTILNKINYKIENYGDKIQRISWNFEGGCPMYCMCDGYHMLWYGDHGSFSFDCTWITSLKKIPFQSPYYLFEKLDRSGARATGKMWDSQIAKKAVLNSIYETSWWEELEESDHVKEEIKSLFEGPYYKSAFNYNTGGQDDDMLDRLKLLLNATQNEWEFISQLNGMEDEDPITSSNDYDLFDCGNVIVPGFWFYLMCLNYIYDCEEAKKEGNDCSEVK